MQEQVPYFKKLLYNVSYLAAINTSISMVSPAPGMNDRVTQRYWHTDIQATDQMQATFDPAVKSKHRKSGWEPVQIAVCTNVRLYYSFFIWHISLCEIYLYIFLKTCLFLLDLYMEITNQTTCVWNK